GGTLAPVVDDVVAEVGGDQPAETDVAAQVVREQVVVPGDAVPARDRRVPVPGKVQALTQQAPLDRDPVAELCDRQDLGGGPAQRQVIGDAVAGPLDEVQRVLAGPACVSLDRLGRVEVNFVIAHANPEIAKHDVVRAYLDAVVPDQDAGAGGILAIDGDKRLVDVQCGLEADRAADAKDDRTRPGRFDGG